MASTNKTPTLELPQWEAADSFGREDLNSAFEKIDAGILETRDTRLRADQLLNLDIPASNLNVMSVDVSGVDWMAYKFILIAFPQMKTSDIRINQGTTYIDHITDGCYIFCFPALTECPQVSFLTAYSFDFKAFSGNLSYPDIKSLYFTAYGDYKFDITTKIRIWGVK